MHWGCGWCFAIVQTRAHGPGWPGGTTRAGRLFWESLHLFDARTTGSPHEVLEACVRHLEYAPNGGRFRPAVTAFASADPEEKGIRLWNTQLIRYAGYRAADGSVLGDPGTGRVHGAGDGDGLAASARPLHL